jgi:membrane fusion protein (multidrug efflux system)
MKAKIIFVLSVVGAVALLVLVVLTTKGMQFGAMSEAGEEASMPPTSVSTFDAESQEWTNSFRAVGSIEPVRGVQLEAEMAGVVDTINFENGQEVEEGELLIQLNVAVEMAQLRAARASARLAAIEYERAKRLRESGNVPQSDLDRAIADLDKANAEVENFEAIIDRKTIRAPFAGTAGIRQVNLGQYVPMGAPLVSIHANDQVYVNFTLPQQTLADVRNGMRLILESDVYPERSFEGEVTAISPQIDEVTRTVELQGTLDNQDGALRAGLFVKVSVILPEKDQVIAIPTTAVIHAPYGNSIFKIEEANGGMLIAKQYFIRTGRTLGDFVEVIDGVTVGDRVVSAGSFKLFNGAPVSLQNDMAPNPQKRPQPDNS